MAKTPFAQGTGSVGGTTTQGGRHGKIQRARVSPTNPQTIAQQNQRSILATVAAEWRGLTDPQRAAWEALASQIGGNLTGFNAYVRVNATRVTCGEAKLEDAPLIPAFGIVTCSGLVATSGGSPVLHLTSVADTVLPDKFMIEAAAPVSQGITNRNAAMRLIAVVAGHTSAANIDILAAFVAKFGAFAAGQSIVARISQVKDGFKGVPLAFRAITT